MAPQVPGGPIQFLVYWTFQLRFPCLHYCDMQSPTNEDTPPAAESIDCAASPPNASEDREPCLQAQETEGLGRPASVDSERPEDTM